MNLLSQYTPPEIDNGPLSQATRNTLADEKNLSILLWDIVSTVPLDLNSDADMLQDWRALDDTRINHMDRNGGEHSNQAHAMPPPASSSARATAQDVVSIAEIFDKTADDVALS